MKRRRFETLVTEALGEIPRRFREAMTNVAVVVEDEPSPELLEEMEVEPPDTLFGLYQGTPLTEREWSYGNALPDRITIFRRPIEEACEDENEIIDQLVNEAVDVTITESNALVPSESADGNDTMTITPTSDTATERNVTTSPYLWQPDASDSRWGLAQWG